MMTLGFVLIFLGAQLALVDSYLLTTRISHFLSQQEDSDVSNVASAPLAQQQPAQAFNPFQQASYQNGRPPLAPGYQGAVTQKRVTPPKWLCWPALFCGTVVLLQGFSMGRD